LVISDSVKQETAVLTGKADAWSCAARLFWVNAVW